MIILTTFPADGDAAALARTLVDERLAACVGVLPLMQSIYRWNGRIEEAGERQLVVKTTAARVDEVRERITALHPYEVPELLVLPVAGGSEAYLDWIATETAAPDRG
ncbi:MAG: divalent-cation tolerance protein CutA [Acidobacteriota bacterium]